MVITGLTNSAGVFESELNTTRWEAFIPPDSPILDEFKSKLMILEIKDGIIKFLADVEVSYIPEVVEEGYFPMEAILTGIQDDYYSISKLELYSNHMDESQLEKSPDRVEKILSRLQTDQLLLQIRIENSSAIEVIPKWIQLIYSLFFKYSFGFIGSLTNGACHQPLGHCIYRASFVKTNISDIVDAPVWGLGSPGEERGRLISYFQKFGNLTNCSRISDFNENLQIPYLCYDFEDFLDCDVLYFRYRQLNQQLLDKLEDYFGTCNMQINHPEPIELIWSEGMFVEYSGLLPKNEPNQISPAKNPKNFWKLESFSTIYEKFKKKSENSQRYLIFDLDGDDLSIFDTIIDDCQIIKKFRQISFRLRIFYGEEYKNYRNLYLYFLKFENCGFSKIFSKRMSLDVFYILLKRNSGFYT